MQHPPRPAWAHKSRGNDAVRLSTRTRYCLRLMIHLAEPGASAQPVSLAAASSETGISRRYLEQLVILLKNAGLVHGVSGRRGGYMLTRKPEEIALADIVSAASGPMSVVPCVPEAKHCLRAEYCTCRPVWVLINHQIDNVLRSFHLGDLVEESMVATIHEHAAALEAGLTDEIWCPGHQRRAKQGEGNG